MAVGARELRQHEAVKASDFPPADAVPRPIALTWFGCTAITASPASSSRSINNPSGRSNATSFDRETLSRAAQRADPRLVVPITPALNDPARRSSITHAACPSLAQSTPANLPSLMTLTPFDPFD